MRVAKSENHPESGPDVSLVNGVVALGAGDLRVSRERLERRADSSREDVRKLEADAVKRILIIYRRNDSEDAAGRLYDRLSGTWPGLVDMDVTGLTPGVAWPVELLRYVEHCAVCILVIGPNWLKPEASGCRRIDDEGDFHRAEVERSLARALAGAISFFVVRHPNAPVLHASNLPIKLARLAEIQSVEVRPGQFAQDVAPLVDCIRKALGEDLGPGARAPAAPPAQGRERRAPNGRRGEPGLRQRILPEMVPIPAGEFPFGADPRRDLGAFSDECPQRLVAVDHEFAVGKYPVTFEEWDEFLRETGYPHHGDDGGWGRGRKPLVDVNWTDAKAYVGWLSTVTGKHYRLLTEIEWEYAARAGSATPFYWGTEFDVDYAHCDSGLGTLAVGMKRPNRFGLFDMAGNVWEWIEDPWNVRQPDYATRAATWINALRHRERRVVKGGAWNSEPRLVRPSARHGVYEGLRDNNLGFRVARTL